MASLAVICFSTFAANCVDRNPVNAGSVIPTNVTLVNS